MQMTQFTNTGLLKKHSDWNGFIVLNEDELIKVQATAIKWFPNVVDTHKHGMWHQVDNVYFTFNNILHNHMSCSINYVNTPHLFIESDQ